ncbi:mycofactocin-coupled SDR family oxidoreductase [Nocardioides rotundus]|uniref:mycofactocin-coupled SDR family oxidoreductase n=1 Tax=Nocardioides rotundus TaxID=1774216 RepID=UPI001CBCE77D|nr:mycofactocin-coupled SDR family oxidoreductase [Nocardioides rotundus]UAL30815.1 mycofactocin-coupled SDR family oxidoreductase [Nocardioides rotundus]
MTDAPRRVALVTGAARGIGAACVHTLAGEGYAVLAVDIAAGAGHGLPGVDYPLAGREQLAAVADAHEHVEALVADVRDAAAMRAAVDRAEARWGRLDVAVAAAAVIAGGAPLWEDDSLDVQWDIDVRGVWHTAAAAVPAMLHGPEPAGCRFVALASVAGDHGLFHLTAYTMAKHAVVGLVRGLAADLAGTGVTAVAVSPGAARTRMLEATAAIYDVPVEDLTAHQLAGEPLDPAEVAAAVAFCCRPEGRVLNGSVVAADGGFRG